MAQCLKLRKNEVERCQRDCVPVQLLPLSRGMLSKWLNKKRKREDESARHATSAPAARRFLEIQAAPVGSSLQPRNADASEPFRAAEQEPGQQAEPMELDEEPEEQASCSNFRPPSPKAPQIPGPKVKAQRGKRERT